jgi:class 3 adenylate cyclase
MSEQAPRRRLTAILAADVVGYSRMMQANEAGTLAALKFRRTAILQPLVSKHHGRIIKIMGDGVLVEFASAVEAVSCAVVLQEAMAIANEAAEESRRVVLRIGVNLTRVLAGPRTRHRPIPDIGLVPPSWCKAGLVGPSFRPIPLSGWAERIADRPCSTAH